MNGIKQSVSQVRSQVKRATQDLRRKAKDVVGGSPGQTAMAGNLVDEVQSRASERFDVLQERRPRVLDQLGLNQIPQPLQNMSNGSSSSSPSPSNSDQVEFSGSEDKGPEPSVGGVTFSE